MNVQGETSCETEIQKWNKGWLLNGATMSGRRGFLVEFSGRPQCWRSKSE
jgi:hypothetical protein